MVTAGPCSNQENVKKTNQYLVKQMDAYKSGSFVGFRVDWTSIETD